MAGSWRTIRVFVSSTFRDMHAERDWLARVVFPELRERCASRELYLTDVDLRWGVTEAEAEQERVLAICLEEIDRCRPFFLGLLGERYGWVPETLPEDALIQFPWVSERRERSLTELEILHGVLNNPNMTGRAFFFFRNLTATGQLPADYQAENSEAASKLARLKQQLKDEKLPVTEYACRWEGKVVGLEEFGNSVLEALWAAICQEYPEDAAPPDALAEEIELHEAQAARLVAGFVGRAEEKQQLTDYVESDSRRALALTGPAGSGKSALLADWVLEYRKANPEAVVVLHFVGASPSSTSHVQTMRRVGEELKRRLGLFSELPDKPEGLEEAFRNLLIEAGGKAKGPVVLVLDGLNQLEEAPGAQGLAWLPELLPSGIRVLASALEGQALEALHRHEAQELVLAPLTTPERKQLVTDFLWEYRKKLSDAQLEALLAKEATENALYLKVALEELRLFGSFEELTKRIQSLPVKTEELFGQVLDRVEGDHTDVFPVAEGLALLAASRSGLSERELLDLVGGEVTTLAWSRVRRSLLPYLVQRGGLLDFAHRMLWKAVKATYGDALERHLKLADHFLGADIARRVTERPWQLEQAEAWEMLRDELVSLEVMQWFNRNNRAHGWFAYWKPLQGKYDIGESCLEAARDAPGKSLDTALLAENAGLLLDHAGRLKEALSLYERALHLCGVDKGFDNPQAARALNNVAYLHKVLGNYPRALQLYELALAINEAQQGANHPDTAGSLNNLAALYKATGQYSKALPLYERALAIYEVQLGGNHPSTAGSLNNLAGLYKAMGQYEQALPLYERALAIREAQLRAGHPDIATSLDNLAELYRLLQRYDEALALNRRALALFEATLGSDHPDTATSVNNQALLHKTIGEYEIALPLYERALRIREVQLGPDHPDTATSLNNLACLYLALGEYKRAESFCEQALAIRQARLGPEHPDTIGSFYNLAVILDGKGDYGRAIPLYERAVELAEKTLGPAHPNTRFFKENLEGCRQAMEQD